MKEEKAIYGARVCGNQGNDPDTGYFEGEVVGRVDMGNGELIVVDLDSAFCGMLDGLYFQYILVRVEYLHLKE